MRKFELPGYINLSEFSRTFDSAGGIQVSDPMLKSSRKGIYHLKFPDDLMATLPGSFADPSILLELFNIPGGSENSLNHLLLSDRLGSISKPVLTLHNKYNTINILHGSFNPLAIQLSRLAAQSLEGQTNRGKYQKTAYEIIRTIIVKPNKNGLHIREDCVATGDSIIGLLEYAKESHPEILKTGIRIDVVCMTVQGIILLASYAEASRLDLTINAGYLAYGLSSGIKEGRSTVPIHANYITYPAELLNRLPDKLKKPITTFAQTDRNYYVVGDMGDAFKSLAVKFDREYPWNRYREDPHGDRNPEGRTLFGFEQGTTIAAYMANGGYFMRSLYRSIDPHEKIGEFIVSAKRIWSDDPKYGYGVLLNG